MKKFAAVALALLMVLSLAACGGEKSSTSAADSGAGTPAESGGTATPAVEVGPSEGFAETPILLTSVGQSADVEMVKLLLEKQELAVVTNNLATSADLGDNKTLVLAVGGSSKGLGAAGINADEEIARAEELIAAADEKGLSIIVIHIGGDARRGELSDRFVEPSFAKANFAVVTKDGNKDGLMTELAQKYGVAFLEVEKMGEVSAPLKAAFK